tara:strand:+ start:79 stop:429 length:351 start_codon:yes stop_codon:yes gene_type:complete
MSTQKTTKQELISIFGEKAKGCRTDLQKIEFFDSSQEAFFTNSNESTLLSRKLIIKELDDAFYVYANMKRFTEKELEELKSRSWRDYPEIFKIFLFDFCILNGDAYSNFFLKEKET